MADLIGDAFRIVVALGIAVALVWVGFLEVLA